METGCRHEADGSGGRAGAVGCRGGGVPGEGTQTADKAAPLRPAGGLFAWGFEYSWWEGMGATLEGKKWTVGNYTVKIPKIPIGIPEFHETT